MAEYTGTHLSCSGTLLRSSMGSVTENDRFNPVPLEQSNVEFHTTPHRLAYYITLHYITKFIVPIIVLVNRTTDGGIQERQNNIKPYLQGL